VINDYNPREIARPSWKPPIRDRLRNPVRM
jgi:hypothetical protein